MGASKREYERVMIELPGGGYSYSVLREKNHNPKLVAKEKHLTSVQFHPMDRLDDYLNRWQSSPDFADEIRDNYLTGNDREY